MILNGVPGFPDQKGYTFLELTVVLLLIGLIVGLATPRIRDTLLTDDLKGSTRTIIGLVKGLREEAIREQKDYALHFDFEANRFWIDSSSMTEEEQARAREKATQLPRSVHVQDIWFRTKGKKMTGETEIRFYKKGYVSHSVIHLGSEDGREMTIELNPFLGRIKVVDRYVEFVS